MSQEWLYIYKTYAYPCMASQGAGYSHTATLMGRYVGNFAEET
jgi:hypothetical protein